jgi:hypothetical protein
MSEFNPPSPDLFPFAAAFSTQGWKPKLYKTAGHVRSARRSNDAVHVWALTLHGWTLVVCINEMEPFPNVFC